MDDMGYKKGIGLVTNMIRGKYSVLEKKDGEIVPSEYFRSSLRRRNQAFDQRNPSLEWMRKIANGFQPQVIPEPEPTKSNSRFKSGYCKNCGVALLPDDNGNCRECGTLLTYPESPSAHFGYQASPSVNYAQAPGFPATAPEHPAQGNLYLAEMSCDICKHRKIRIIRAESFSAAENWLDGEIIQWNRMKHHKHYTKRTIENAPRGALESDWKKVEY